MNDLERQLGKLGDAVDEQHAPLSLDEIVVQSVGTSGSSGPHSVGPLVLLAALVGVAAVGSLVLFLSDDAGPNATELIPPTAPPSTSPSSLPDASADRTMDAFAAVMATVRDEYLSNESIVYVVRYRWTERSLSCLGESEPDSPRYAFCSGSAALEYQSPSLTEGELAVIDAVFQGVELRYVDEASQAFASLDRYEIIDDAQLLIIGAPVEVNLSYYFSIDFDLFGVVLEASPEGDGWDVDEVIAWIA